MANYRDGIEVHIFANIGHFFVLKYVLKKNGQIFRNKHNFGEKVAKTDSTGRRRFSRMYRTLPNFLGRYKNNLNNFPKNGHFFIDAVFRRFQTSVHNLAL